MEEQATLWEQPNLLGVAAPAPAPPPPPAAPPEPAAPGPAAAPAPVSLPELPSLPSRGLSPAPERLLILDTETTALSPAEGRSEERV